MGYCEKTVQSGHWSLGVLGAALLVGALTLAGLARGAALPSSAEAFELRERLAAPDTLGAPADTTDRIALQSDSLRGSFRLYRPRRHRAVPDRSPSLFPSGTRRTAPWWQPKASSGASREADERTSAPRRGEEPTGPFRDLDAYRQERRDQDLRAGLQNMARERGLLRHEEQQDGVGVNINIPGGETGPFTTIFGQPEVDLRVTGRADIQGGFDYRQSDQQVAVTGTDSQIDPDFQQDLLLGITGTIGDKLQVDVNWDTDREFDYQNQLRLQYTGYEDEIIQSVEAGNVSLQTPSSLIRGGQSLFGIKSELQFGDLHLTTVASQQEGQSNTLSISGGSELTSFEFRSTDYDEMTHYFLGYYFRNRWETAHSRPQDGLILSDGFERITDVEVWKLQSGQEDEDDPGRQVVATVDLGEPPDLVDEAGDFTTVALPERDADQYDYAPGGEVDQELRDGQASPREYLEASKGLSSTDYQTGQFVRLEEGRDYDVHDRLGYVSLRQRLQDGEALAVAFRYNTQDGRNIQVGDVASESGGSDGGATSDRLVLKLLRPSNLRSPNASQDIDPAAWYLELRNLYRIGSDIREDDFELDIEYQPSGQQSSRRLPGVAGQETLLQLLGLDRLTEQGAPEPDNDFDFTPLTIDQNRGLLIFPYLEPFGEHLEETIDEEAEEAEQEELKDRYVFSSLYDERKENAERDSRRDLYHITGSYRGASEGFYDLRAPSGLVEGSVRVTSGGTSLQEGSDYIVDYESGTVTITNENYLAAGSDIDIDYEQNAFMDMEQKTLLGARADYSFSEQMALGATIMRMSERSMTDRFRVGEEPISNMIWGLDGSMELSPQWLTAAVDALPLIQTREPSSVALSGEIAQLRPGHSQTTAFRNTRRNLRDQDRDFQSDELDGISYIDDFESFENTFSLSQPDPWMISSAPDSIAATGATEGVQEDSLRTNYRASLGWYQLNANMLRELGEDPRDPSNPATALVPTEDIFPGRETLRQDNIVPTLDLYFNPHERGPYNFTTDLRGFLDNPEESWGGIFRNLPDRYSDFSLNNIEFVEFVVNVHSDGTGGDAGDNAKLYVDLGQISEDVLPNRRLNSEDGLSLSARPSASNLDDWGRMPSTTPNRAVDFDRDSRRTQDLGLNGLPSFPDSDFPEDFTERDAYGHLLQALDPDAPDALYRAEAAKMRRDPAADAYFYYTDSYFDDPEFFPPELYPNGVPLQQRFSRYQAGYELSTYEGQNTLASDRSERRGRTSRPATEDLNNNGVLDTEDSFYQYEVPLSTAALDSMASPDRTDNYVVERIADAEDGSGWYLVRIPVRNPDRTVGNIRDFSRIETMRVWTTGHEAPATMRFARMELVGSQWRDSEEVYLEDDEATANELEETRLFVENINSEENANTYRRPIGSLITQIRDPSGAQVDAREQSLVMRVENLRPRRQHGVYRTYGQPYNLLRYSNLRMFVHFHGRLSTGEDLADLAQRDMAEAREKARLFVRLGSNETDDYYEYEQPLTPSNPTSGNPDELWQTASSYLGEHGMDLGSVNVDLGSLNQLKYLRDQDPEARADSVYWSSESEVELQPRPDEIGPPDARLGIKGTPSLERINTVIIGVRNPDENATGDVLEEAVVWVNELRVTGYDERDGWAGLFDADVNLADVGRVRGNFQFQTDGFGSLTSSLDEREQTNLENWSLSGELNANKFLPDRYGWSIPLSLQLRSNEQMPRFDPNRGDIRIEELLEAVEERTDDSERQRFEQDAILDGARTRDDSRSFTARLQKSNSETGLLRHTLDGLSLSYSYSDTRRRSPTQSLNDRWSWNTTLNYQLDVPRPETIRPFGFLGGAPLLGLLSDLEWNLLPQAVNFSATASRRFNQSRERPDIDRIYDDDHLLEIDYPFREQQSFNHTRSFGLQYNPFQFLNLRLDTNTEQSLNELAARARHSVVLTDSAQTQVRSVYDGLSQEEALAETDLTDADFGVTAFETSRMRPLSSGRVLGQIFSGADSPRPERYGQRFTGTLRPNLDAASFLDWISLQDIIYSADYNWRNASLGSSSGASVDNQVNIRTGLTLRPVELWRRIPAYRELERQQQERDQQQGQNGEEEANGSLSLPNPLHLLRRTFLGMTGVRDFQVTYTTGRTASSSNVGQVEGDDVDVHYSLYDALRGEGPSLGYRFGLDRTIDPAQRVLDPSLQVADALSDNHQIQARTTLNFSPELRVNLNWRLEWTDREDHTFTLDSSGNVQSAEVEGGSNTASIWAFGANYLDFFERQYESYRSDREQTPSGEAVHDADNDGRVALTNQSTSEDFWQVYGTSLGMLNGRTLLPFPMPGWTVDYGGLSNWPFVRSLVQSASLRHSYSADYNTNFRSNLTDEAENSFNLGGRLVRYEVSDLQIDGIRINERFQPFLGLDLNWTGNFQTNLAWSTSNSYTLGTSDNAVRESKTDELSLTASLRQDGFTLPFFSDRRLNNRITFSLTLSRSVTDQRRHSLLSAMQEAAGDPYYEREDALDDDNSTIVSSTERIIVNPRISYQFSNRVTADFFVRYEHTDDFRLAGTTNINGGFNLRMDIAN